MTYKEKEDKDDVSEVTTSGNVGGYVVPIGMKAPFMNKDEYEKKIKDASKKKKSGVEYPLMRWDSFMKKQI